MRPEQNFIPERIIAQHCAELLPQRKAVFEAVQAGKEVSRLIANEAMHCLGPAVGGSNLKLVCENIAKTSTTAYLNRLGKNYAHAVVDLAGAVNFLISIEIADVLSLTDRAYGGSGEVPDVLPDELPLSADLSLRQIEMACCEAIIKAYAPIIVPVLGESEPMARIARRGRDMGKLDPFRGKPECVEFGLIVEEPGRELWKICIALGLHDIYKLTELTKMAQAEPVAPPQPNDPFAQPFCDVELPAAAVLSEMPISLAKLATLSEGDVIPLAIFRQVPIRIGDLTIAYGQIGTKDDRVALQISTTQ